MLEKLIIQTKDGIALNCDTYQKLIESLIFEFEERLKDFKEIYLPKKLFFVENVKNEFGKQYIVFSNTIKKGFSELPAKIQETLLLFKKEFKKIYKEYVSYMFELKEKK